MPCSPCMYICRLRPLAPPTVCCRTELHDEPCRAGQGAASASGRRRSQRSRRWERWERRRSVRTSDRGSAVLRAVGATFEGARGDDGERRPAARCVVCDVRVVQARVFSKRRRQDLRQRSPKRRGAAGIGGHRSDDGMACRWVGRVLAETTKFRRRPLSFHHENLQHLLIILVFSEEAIYHYPTACPTRTTMYVPSPLCNFVIGKIR